jgi:hypothetical protein
MKKILNNIKHMAGIAAVLFSVLLYSCDSNGSSVDNTTDVLGGSDMDNAGGDPADTLSIGGSSNGRPTGAGIITDSVATPGVRMDSIQQSQSGTNASSYGNNANVEDNKGLQPNKPSGENVGNSSGGRTQQKKGNNQ